MTRTLNISACFTLAATSALILFARPAEAQDCGWKPRASMPTARYALGSVSAFGKIYAVGGTSMSTGIRGEVERYEPEADVWETLEPMSEPAYAFGFDAIERHLYRVGGADASGPTDKVMAYDIDANTWAALEPLPVAASELTATAIDGKLYAVGGVTREGSNDLPISLVHRYDPEANAWTALAPLPTARYGHGAAAVDGKLYILGGGEEDGMGSAGLSRRVSVYDPETDAWSESTPMLAHRVHSAVAVHGTTLYIAGGTELTAFGPNVSAAVDRFDTITGSWSQVGYLFTSRMFAGASFVEDRLYVMGGGYMSTSLGDVDALPVLAKSGPLYRTEAEAPGENCPNGGSRLVTGLDTNCNGELDEGDTAETVYLCHGEDGAPSDRLLVETKDEVASEHCQAGGIRIDAGYDIDGDGKLSPDEVKKTTFVCHGDKGPGGPDGSSGVDGSDGRDGEAGSEGGCSVVPGGAPSGTFLAAALAACALLASRLRGRARA